MSLPTQRAGCSRCLRALKACICACIRPVENQVEVLILQHKAEATHIKNTARLLHLCLSHSVLLCDDEVDDAALARYLAPRNAVLLYPAPHASTVPVFAPPPKGVQSDLSLLLIDASWRQSRQVLGRFPVLQTLPQYALPDSMLADYTSRYRIRRAHHAHQLSTLEAAYLALRECEHSETRFLPLLDALDAFNQLQLDFGVHNLKR